MTYLPRIGLNGGGKDWGKKEDWGKQEEGGKRLMIPSPFSNMYLVNNMEEGEDK